ncbi:MAG: hypothetical protein Q8P56_00985 [Candidatus Uhrbacteria bacterium]|nr:hypothetical protein [Candidatus Uhrbacteria bacterium]
MTSQVIFKIDQKLKTRAMRKAKSEGMPFASILKLATQAYVDGSLDVELVVQEKPNKKTQAQLKRAHNDFKQGKNISPSFSNAQDAIAYLKQL